MSIIHCPACGKRTSSVQKVCPHCNADLNVSETDMSSMRRQLKDRLYKMRMWGYVALTVMVLAIIIWWVPTKGRLVDPAQWLKMLFLVGLAGQLFTRYHIIQVKRRLKGLEKDQH